MEEPKGHVEDPTLQSPHGAAKGSTALSPRRAVGKLVIASALGLVGGLLLTPRGTPGWGHLIVGWDLGAFALLILEWAVILSSNAATTRARAGADDPGRAAVFGVAIASALAGLFAAAFALKQTRTMGDPVTWTSLTIGAIALSWGVTHTAFTLQYAHLYYRGHRGHGGLNFPGVEPPGDTDFAYFAFTIGMCFQVSDVAVTNALCRRAVLQHSLLSFVYNTAIVAFAVNLAVGLMP